MAARAVIMASRRNKATRRMRKWMPASFYDLLLYKAGKPYVTIERSRQIEKARDRFFSKCFKEWVVETNR